MKKVRFLTLGCKVNQYETQAMRELLFERGMSETAEGPCDVVVINTCTVTSRADRENRYWIRRLRRENPRARIVVTGCWVQRDRSEAGKLSEVDLILLNHEKEEIAKRLFQGCGTPAFQEEEIRWDGPYDRLQISSFEGRARAFVKIQDGCNHACSFCKVVLVRGRFRSRPLPSILEEAGRLREIVLTGIQLGAYGSDQEPTLNLVSVLEALASVPGIERIRLSSIEPTDVKPELIRAMKTIPTVCPQLHIPLQSGDEEVLKRMNRRYGRAFYLDLVTRLRSEIQDFCLSIDVMVGFPGEEEAPFQNTLALIEEVRPIRVHAFPYSRRSGTRAARFPDLLPHIVRERMGRVIAFSKGVIQRERQRFLGRTLPVLVEKRLTEEGIYQGHTPHYLKVTFPAPFDCVGQTVQAHLAEVAVDGFIGHWPGGLP